MIDQTTDRHYGVLYVHKLDSPKCVIRQDKLYMHYMTTCRQHLFRNQYISSNINNNTTQDTHELLLCRKILVTLKVILCINFVY